MRLFILLSCAVCLTVARPQNSAAEGVLNLPNANANSQSVSSVSTQADEQTPFRLGNLPTSPPVQSIVVHESHGVIQTLQNYAEQLAQEFLQPSAQPVFSDNGFVGFNEIPQQQQSTLSQSQFQASASAPAPQSQQPAQTQILSAPTAPAAQSVPATAQSDTFGPSPVDIAPSLNAKAKAAAEKLANQTATANITASVPQQAIPASNQFQFTQQFVQPAAPQPAQFPTTQAEPLSIVQQSTIPAQLNVQPQSNQFIPSLQPTANYVSFPQQQYSIQQFVQSAAPLPSQVSQSIPLQYVQYPTASGVQQQYAPQQGQLSIAEAIPIQANQITSGPEQTSLSQLNAQIELAQNPTNLAPSTNDRPKYAGDAPQVQQTTTVHKHIYVHVPPPEFEEPAPQPSTTPATINNQKHVQILFIKAPAPPTPKPIERALLPQNEEKTLVYVLVKKPEEQKEEAPQEIPEPKVNRPEVFFIKYDTKKEAETKAQLYDAAQASEDVQANQAVIDTNAIVPESPLDVQASNNEPLQDAPQQQLSQIDLNISSENIPQLLSSQSPSQQYLPAQ